MLFQLCCRRFFGFLTFGENHEPGRVAVKAVDDEELVARVFPFQIIAQDAVGSAVLDFIRTHREKPVALVDDDDVIVFIDEFQATVVEHAELACQVGLYLIALFKLGVKLCHRNSVDCNLIVAQKVLDCGAFSFGHCLYEKFEQA